jgi:hypothetical protein
VAYRSYRNAKKKRHQEKASPIRSTTINLPYAMSSCNKARKASCVYRDDKSIRETAVAMEKQYYISPFVFVACYSACKEYAPYYTVICGLAATIFSNVIS